MSAVWPTPPHHIPQGQLEWAHFVAPPLHLISNRTHTTERRRQGVRYERRIHEHMQERYPNQYIAAPWIRFKMAQDRPRLAQPDGLLIDIYRGRVILVEVKYQHCLDAWWQLERKYRPLVEHIFPAAEWKVSTCEVVRWYDPAVRVPDHVNLCPEVTWARRENFNVHICTP